LAQEKAQKETLLAKLNKKSSVKGKIEEFLKTEKN